MNPRHPAWALLPILGILAGWLFRPTEGMLLPGPASAEVEVRTLSLPTGEALRFRKGPDMSVWLSETEVPTSWVGKEVSLSEAQAFCRELSELTGQSLRLPTAEEWRQAARAGIPTLPTPWGFDPEPPESLLFDLQEAPDTPGPALGYGFRDLAGGRWEWTQEGLLLGGAWSESNPETLQIDHAWSPPPGYGDQDTGIRLVWDR